MNTRLLCAALLGTALALSACESKTEEPQPTPTAPAPGAGNVEVHVENVAGTSSLVLNTPYTTAAGDAFRVTELKYYLSNVKLLRADGTSWDAPNSYYLVDQAQTASQHLTLADVPYGDYTRMRFTIGVDSVRNMAGAQSGALDPAHGMFWDWSQGYIFLRLNGSSPQAPNNNGLFFDVAGFRRPYNTIRTVTLPMPSGTTALHVRAGATPEMHLKGNVLKIFDGPNPIRFSATSSVAGGADAMKMADNYAAGMFSIDHIHSN